MEFIVGLIAGVIITLGIVLITNTFGKGSGTDQPRPTPRPNGPSLGDIRNLINDATSRDPEVVYKEVPDDEKTEILRKRVEDLQSTADELHDEIYELEGKKQSYSDALENLKYEFDYYKEQGNQLNESTKEEVDNLRNYLEEEYEQFISQTRSRAEELVSSIEYSRTDMMAKIDSLKTEVSINVDEYDPER